MYFCCQTKWIMLEVGKYNTLKIVKDLDFGVYLDGGNGKEILLPARYVPKNVKPGVKWKFLFTMIMRAG